MTGGIGFSRQGKQSFEDNHRLGKIRPKISVPEGSSTSQRSAQSMEEIRLFHEKNREKNRKQGLVITAFLILLISLVVSFFTWYFK